MSASPVLPEYSPAGVPELDPHPVEDGRVVVVGQAVAHYQVEVKLKLVKCVVPELLNLNN